MIDPSTTTIVVNPAAAGGRVGRQYEAIAAMLTRKLGPATIVRTAGTGDGMRCAAEAVRGGARTLVSLGGDGTHSEVVGGILSVAPPDGSIRLGVLHAGTGGDFRRLLTEGRDLEAGAAALATATDHPIDVGKIRFRATDGSDGERWFVNIASCGMSGLVDRLVNESGKRFGGRISFFLATMRAFRIYEPAEVRVTVDGRTSEPMRISTVAVCNGRFAGGGMMFAPEARLADGLFDVIAIRHTSIAKAIRLSPLLYRGEHTKRADLCWQERGRHVRVEPLTEAPAYVDIDGEAPGVAPMELDVVPGAIRLIGPRPDVL